MRVAVVGGGISGLVVASLLHPEYEITLFDAGDSLGGHTHTVDVDMRGKRYSVDTGFIVYNDWTYPNFVKILDRLGVKTQESSMSFSVRDEATGLEYNGTSINTLFAQRRNILKPSFHGMILDILRFHREAPAVLEGDTRGTVGEFVQDGKYRRAFVDNYLVPLGASIWSCPSETFFQFPIRFLVSFLKNHGMLSVNERPTWRVVQGGSRSYLAPLTAPFADRIRVATPIVRVQRYEDRVVLRDRDGHEESFDEVVLACHSDQALRMLEDPTAMEKELLGAFPYQENDVILHTDSRVLPKTRRAWASWNYLIPRKNRNRVSITYNMNILQSLDGPDTFCVTLNDPGTIDEKSILERFVYDHPVFTLETESAQARHSEVIRKNRTSYCGAYWRYGFHEDGVVSGLRVAEAYGRTLS